MLKMKHRNMALEDRLDKLENGAKEKGVIIKEIEIVKQCLLQIMDKIFF